MKRLFAWIVLLAALLCSAAGAAQQSSPGVDTPGMEKRVLFGGESAKEWSPAECTVEPSSERVKATQSSLHWHVPVDFNAGEAKYPVGWPRFGRAIPEGPLRDWTGWDFLHFWVYTGTTRDALPREPAGLGLHTPDRANAYHRSLAELKKGEWVEVNIPLSQIPRHNDVRYIQFNISESNYRDGDQIDFTIDDLALLRYARPTLLEFAAESAVVFSGSGRLPIRFRLVGVKPGESADVACELQAAGRVAARVSVKAERGPLRVALDLGPKGLAPGTYTLSARVAGGHQATARVRVVETPW